jgi:hypothetical protein
MGWSAASGASTCRIDLVFDVRSERGLRCCGTQHAVEEVLSKTVEVPHHELDGGLGRVFTAGLFGS